MGREIRRVPKDWEHPKDSKGAYIPLFDLDYENKAEIWLKECVLWSEGKHADQCEEHLKDNKYFWEYDSPPNKECHRPKFLSDPICYQIYETVSEGTPVSPVFYPLAQLIEWLVSQGHSQKAAMKFAKTGYAPSAAIKNGEMKMNTHTCEDFKP